MFKIKGLHYHNDYTQNQYEKSFNTLEDIFGWLKSTSNDFTSSWNYFPIPTENSVNRISICDETNRGYTYYIHQIETENGIVFSTGKYTSGNMFCARKIKEWLEECNDKMKYIKTKPNFIEI